MLTLRAIACFQQALSQRDGEDKGTLEPLKHANGCWSEAEAALLHCGLADTAVQMHAAAQRWVAADRHFSLALLQNGHSALFDMHCLICEALLQDLFGACMLHSPACLYRG